VERLALGAVIRAHAGGQPGSLDVQVRTALGPRIMHVVAATPEAAQLILRTLEAERAPAAPRPAAGAEHAGAGAPALAAPPRAPRELGSGRTAAHCGTPVRQT